MNDQPSQAKNWLEWTVFGIGLILVSALVGYLIYDALTAETGPPRVEIELGPVWEQGGDFAIPVMVTNHGHETAQEVQIQVTLKASDGETEEARFPIAHLPRGATRRGVVLFEHNPAGARELRPRVLGYQQP